MPKLDFVLPKCLGPRITGRMQQTEWNRDWGPEESGWSWQQVRLSETWGGGVCLEGSIQAKAMWGHLGSMTVVVSPIVLNHWRKTTICGFLAYTYLEMVAPIPLVLAWSISTAYFSKQKLVKAVGYNGQEGQECKHIWAKEQLLGSAGSLLFFLGAGYLGYSDGKCSKLYTHNMCTSLIYIIPQ